MSRDAPENFNQLYGDKFRLVLQKTPNVEFFVISVNLPGMSINPQEIHNPVNKFYVGSTKLEYEPLQLTFRVDENLINYIEIVNWVKGIAAPEHTDQYKDFTKANSTVNQSRHAIYSDGSLITMTNNSNVNMRISFRNMFPISISGLDLNLDTNVTLSASVTFRYDFYNIETF